MTIASAALTVAGLRLVHSGDMASEWLEDVVDGPGLKRHVLSNGAQRWRLTVVLEPTVPGLKDYRAALLSALESQLGAIGSFELEVPQLVTLPPGQPAVTATGGARGRAVEFSQPLPIGRFVSFAGHGKVYQLSEADEVTPPLRRTLAAAAVNLSPTMRVRFAAPASGFAADRRSGAVRITRTLVEVL